MKKLPNSAMISSGFWFLAIFQSRPHNIISRHNFQWVLVSCYFPGSYSYTFHNHNLKTKINIPSICSNWCLPFIVNVDMREKARLRAGGAKGVLQVGVAEGEGMVDVGGL